MLIESISAISFAGVAFDLSDGVLVFLLADNIFALFCWSTRYLAVGRIDYKVFGWYVEYQGLYRHMASHKVSLNGAEI